MQNPYRTTQNLYRCEAFLCGPDLPLRNPEIYFAGIYFAGSTSAP